MEGLKVFLSGLFILLVFGLLLFYWFIPTKQMELVILNKGEHPKDSNFILNGSESTEMQFYPNMRYPDSKISYSINEEHCTLTKQNEAKIAFEILENKTKLDFYPTSSNGEILVTCSEEVRVNEDFFIAGEGGPVNITKTKNFHVISSGKVLLLRSSDCPRPNVAIHEILHALGFVHSENPINIMYPKTRCDQTIGENIPKLIEKIYSIESLPDLEIENQSAMLKGVYLNLNVSIKNNGLKDAGEGTFKIYSDEDLIKEKEIQSLEVGEGLKISFKNLQAGLNTNEIAIEIDTSYKEIDKNNNKIKLKIKE